MSNLLDLRPVQVRTLERVGPGNSGRFDIDPGPGRSQSIFRCMHSIPNHMPNASITIGASKGPADGLGANAMG